MSVILLAKPYFKSFFFFFKVKRSCMCIRMEQKLKYLLKFLVYFRFSVIFYKKKFQLFTFLAYTIISYIRKCNDSYLKHKIFFYIFTMTNFIWLEMVLLKSPKQCSNPQCRLRFIQCCNSLKLHCPSMGIKGMHQAEYNNRFYPMYTCICK